MRGFLPGESRRVTQNALSGIEADPGTCGCVSQVKCLGGGITVEAMNV